MSYKELEVGYQDLRSASFYIGDEIEGYTSLGAEELVLGDTVPTTYDYVYTSAHSPTRTTHPNCPLCLQVVSISSVKACLHFVRTYCFFTLLSFIFLLHVCVFFFLFSFQFLVLVSLLCFNLFSVDILCSCSFFSTSVCSLVDFLIWTAH